MKVTISFNGTKIVVPCGDGDISVQEVTNLAATRYKKAIGKTSAYWVSVASLKSHEGGILDPDDLICDVCDDREQLDAIYDEQDGGHYHGGGDGMSSASDSDTKESVIAAPGASSSSASMDNLLQNHRKGSEPNLSNEGSTSVQAVIASINARSTSVSSGNSVPRSVSSNVLTRQASGDHFLLPGQNQQQHLRSSLRKTMVNSYGYSVYPEDRSNQQSSPDSQYEGDQSGSLSVMRRREPLGASGNKPERPKSPNRGGGQMMMPKNDEETYFDIVIPNEIGPLGIHVVPCDTDGRLVVQGIEPGGRIDRDGRLAVGDGIVAINGYPLRETSFNKAQEIFKEALYAKELRLRVLKGHGLPPDLMLSLESSGSSENNKENEIDKCNTLSRKTEMAAGTKITSAVHANNTRKIGKILKISLRKGSAGLGFSITTRDNALGDNTPIYIKNILPKGAAIEDGSLKPGDRLLEVNEVCVDGMCQSDVVTLLRNVPLDSTVALVVSRHAVDNGEPQQQECKTSSPNKTGTKPVSLSSLGSGRKLQFQLQNRCDDKDEVKTDEEPMDSLEPASSMPSSCASPGISSDNYDDMTSDEFQFPWKQREILTFDIPVHDSERAGLGVSVKGKTSTGKEGVVDLGIFVKSVLHGGAASRDGRLVTNDQLISINGMSLLGKANPAAMETLRKAMHEEGPVPGIISLTVARKKEPGLEPPAAAPPLSKPSNLARRDSLSSLPTSSDDEVVREYHVSAPSFVQPPPSFKMPSTSSLKGSRNPVIDRLMGKDASSSLVPSNLRNESYYMATSHETWNGSMIQQQMDQRSPNASPDSVFIEQPTMMPTDNDDDVTVTDDHINTRESLTSLVEIYPPFARDMPGRQSMSEKRHATLDAKSTDTYQKRKKAREDREKMKQQQGGNNHQQLWKKSASLESLQIHENKSREMMSPYQRANSVRVSRNRGCNESFRAAVDRSYEKDFPEVGPTADYVIQDLSSEGSKDTKVVMRRKDKQNSEEQRKKNRNSKLLRGFGNMFKLGSSSSNNNNAIERSKETKVMRKSMPGPEALTSASSLGSNVSSSTNSSAAARGPAKSSSDLPSEPPHQSYYQQQTQMRLFPQQYVPQPHPRSHSQPRYSARQHPPDAMYEYMPSSIMRPGSRVGIADPTSTEIADYDVIQRLQNTHVQPPPPPPVASRQPTYGGYVYPPPQQQYSMYNQYGYHQQALPQIAHHRTGSNLSSGSGDKPQRPKSNYFEYDLYNNGHAGGSGNYMQHPSHFNNNADQYGQPRQSATMYSMPRSSSGYP